MTKITSKTLINRSKSYSVELFEDDLDNMLDYYYKLPSINIDDIRKEINGWNFSITKESLADFDEVSIIYFTYIEYQNRLNKITDDVVMHEEMLEFIIKNSREIFAQLTDGTAKYKDSVAATMLLPLSLIQVEISSLSAYIKATQKTIDYGTQQLARILREREALAKINNDNYREGQAAKYKKQQNTNISIKTKNNFGLD